MFTLVEKIVLIFAVSFATMYITFSFTMVFSRSTEEVELENKFVQVNYNISQSYNEITQVNYNISNTYIGMIHIPKTAGSSFYDQYKHRYKFLIRSPGPDERSYTYYVNEIKKHGYNKVKLFTFFREPEKHVYSMYLECKYDSWGQRVTRKTNFPRISEEDESIGFTPGFDQWLEHFTKNQTTTDMFNCYQPLNIQTRYFMSTIIEPHNFDYTHNFTSETKRRINDLWFYGLTEYYTLSTCVVEFLVSTTLSDACRCPYQPKNVDEKRITHGVPPHPYKSLSNNTKQMVNQLVSEDRKLYDYAKKMFFKKVAMIESKNDIKFCY